MTDETRSTIWDAINAYARSCGWDGRGNPQMFIPAVLVDRAIDSAVRESQAEMSAALDAAERENALLREELAQTTRGADEVADFYEPAEWPKTRSERRCNEPS